MDTETGCKGCRASVRISEREVERLLADYLRGRAVPLAGDATYARRLALCRQCPDLAYGTTCRHCGCLVAVRAKLADKGCPALPPRWHAMKR